MCVQTVQFMANPDTRTDTEQMGKPWAKRVLGYLFALLALGAWIQHIVTTIQAEVYGQMFIGAFVFPVGILHGLGIWLGLVK